METDLSEAASQGKNNVVVLEARKKVLEAALQAKTEELRRLCVAEAELTGELPPETPFGPGEEPPLFRRRVHTAFTLPNNLIDKIHSTQEESLLGLELEYEIQSRITSAALHLANDCSAKKNVRRQRRLIHQQSQRRLMELEARLSMVQQNVNHKPQKPRKKPRPPLDTGFSKDTSPDIECDPILQDDGISLSPLGMQLESQASPSIHSNSSDSQWHPRGPDIAYCKPESRNQPSLLLLLHSPHHQQHRGPPVYVQPHPTYLSEQSNSQGHRLSHNMGYYYVDNYSHGQPPPHQLPDGQNASCNERMGYGPTGMSQWKTTETDGECMTTQHIVKGMGKYNNGQHFLSLDKLKAESGPNFRQTSLGNRSFRRHRDRFGSLDRQKHAYSSTCLESRSVDDLDALQGGLEGTPTCTPNAFSSSEEGSDMHATSKSVECKDDTVESERDSFPTANDVTPESNVHELQKEPLSYNSRNVSTKAGTSGKGTLPIEALLPGQTYPEHSLGHLASTSTDRVLLRTQSLGSVETSNSNTRSVVDVPELRQVNQQNFPDSSLKKLKEKEWYETSLDTPASSQFSHPVANRSNWKSLNTLKPESVTSSKDQVIVSRTVSNNNNVDVPDGRCLNNNPNNSLSPDMFFQQAKSGSEFEVFDTVVPFELPKNHMVIQAGKWQPYWEVTKPFEMSDFYKYSTKFRKNHPVSTNNDTSKPSKSPQPVIPSTPVPASSHHPPASRAVNSSHQAGVSWEQPKSPQECGSVIQSPTKSPQQKGIYMPLQPLTCHPLEPPQQASTGVNLRRGISASPVNSAQSWNRSMTSSSLPMDIQSKGSGLHSRDGALSAELIAWHQDQNVSHSATLV